MNIQQKIKDTINQKSFSTKTLLRGFSIVEILVYLAIFTAISILVINMFITIISSFNATSINRKLLESGQVSMERISREIRQAKTIDVANSSTATLQLNSTDNLGTDVVVQISQSGSSLNLYKDGVNNGNLLNNNVILSNLIFRRIATIRGEAVKIEMTLQYTEGKSSKTENFYNTILLRGGY